MVIGLESMQATDKIGIRAFLEMSIERLLHTMTSWSMHKRDRHET